MFPFLSWASAAIEGWTLTCFCSLYLILLLNEVWFHLSDQHNESLHCWQQRKLDSHTQIYDKILHLHWMLCVKEFSLKRQLFATHYHPERDTFFKDVVNWFSNLYTPKQKLYTEGTQCPMWECDHVSWYLKLESWYHVTLSPVTSSNA